MGAVSREYPVAPIAAVGAVIVDHGKALLVRRGQEPALGTWVIPGGAIELGETAEQALRRELREECGLDVAAEEVAAVIDRIDLDPGGRVRFHYVIVDYFARHVSGELSAASDASEACWVPLSELPAYGVSQRSLDLFTAAAERAL
jgi:8-oxo-dGTP diphosphatase